MWKSLKKDLQKLPVENRIIKKTKKPKKTGTRKKTKTILTVKKKRVIKQERSKKAASPVCG